MTVQCKTDAGGERGGKRKAWCAVPLPVVVLILLAALAGHRVSPWLAAESSDQPASAPDGTSPFPVERAMERAMDSVFRDLRRAGKIFSVESEQLTPADFYSFVRVSEPVLIRGIGRLLGKPAEGPDGRAVSPVANWTDSYLLSKAGDAKVPVEVSPNSRFAYYLSSFARKKMRFKEFLSTYAQPDVAETMYIAEWRLPKALEEDLEVPAFASFMELDRLNMWMTSGQKIESLPHTDADENILVQLDGVKTLRLVEPTRMRHVYNGGRPDSADDVPTNLPPNYATVDFFQPDYGRFPHFRNVTVYEVVLHPGDALYIPSFWWHHVRTSQSGERTSFQAQQQGVATDLDRPRALALNFWFKGHALVDTFLELWQATALSDEVEVQDEDDDKDEVDDDDTDDADDTDDDDDTNDDDDMEVVIVDDGDGTDDDNNDDDDAAASDDRDDIKDVDKDDKED